MRMEPRIISPPMVGVPALAKWVSGPSSRIGCPLPCFRRRREISRGPNMKTRNSAVMIAPPVRNVM